MLLSLAPLASGMLVCSQVVTGDYKFEFSKLGGPHSVVTTQFESIPETHTNTTYTLDPCDTLKKSGKEKKTEECPNGTRGKVECVGRGDGARSNVRLQSARFGGFSRAIRTRSLPSSPSQAISRISADPCSSTRSND